MDGLVNKLISKMYRGIKSCVLVDMQTSVIGPVECLSIHYGHPGSSSRKKITGVNNLWCNMRTVLLINTVPKSHNRPSSHQFLHVFLPFHLFSTQISNGCAMSCLENKK